MTAKVIRFDRGLPPLTPVRSEHISHACRHAAAVRVDARARVVECTDCGRELDPYEVLACTATWFELLERRIEQLQKEG